MLDDTNSRRYRPRAAAAKHAVLCWEPRRYELSWGEQHFDGPHVCVLDPAGAYGVELTTFFATHQADPGRVDHYFKVVGIRASLVYAPFTLITWLQGRIEMVADVPAGAIVVQNPQGELYAMSNAEFHARYEPDIV